MQISETNHKVPILSQCDARNKMTYNFQNIANCVL